MIPVHTNVMKTTKMLYYVQITTVNNVLYIAMKNHSVYTVKYDFSKIIGIGIQ